MRILHWQVTLVCYYPFFSPDPRTFLLLGILLASFTGEHQDCFALGTGLGVVGWWRCLCEVWWVAKVQIGIGTPRGKEGCWTLT